jgi:hypothetical protein
MLLMKRTYRFNIIAEEQAMMTGRQAIRSFPYQRGWILLERSKVLIDQGKVKDH